MGVMSLLLKGNAACDMVITKTGNLLLDEWWRSIFMSPSVDEDGLWKIATWTVTEVNDKGYELMNEMKERKNKIYFWDCETKERGMMK